MNEQKYDEIMALIDGLMDAKPGTPEEEELVKLSELVEKYEDEHYPIELPSPYPCQSGHNFTWSSGTTNNCDPPYDMICGCGQMEWLAEKHEWRYRYHLEEKAADG